MERTPQVDAAQNRILLACFVFMFGSCFTWVSAILEARTGTMDSNTWRPSLSGMASNWDYTSGRGFFLTNVMTGIILIASAYWYFLPNAHISNEAGDRVIQFLREVSCFMLVCVGVVPAVILLENQPMAPPNRLQEWFHLVTSALFFSLFALAEFFTVRRHLRLGEEERYWRACASGAMIASSTLFVIHRLLLACVFNGILAETWSFFMLNWVFHWELGIASAFVWQMQLIHYYSDSYFVGSSQSCCSFRQPWPYLLVLFFVLPVDLLVRGDYVAQHQPFGSFMLTAALYLCEFVSFGLLAWCGTKLSMNEHACSQTSQGESLTSSKEISAACVAEKGYGAASQ